MIVIRCKFLKRTLLIIAQSKNFRKCSFWHIRTNTMHIKSMIDSNQMIQTCRFVDKQTVLQILTAYRLNLLRHGKNNQIGKIRKETYLYLSSMSTDHINHFDVRPFIYWLIYLRKKGIAKILICYLSFMKRRYYQDLLSEVNVILGGGGDLFIIG